MNRQIILAFVIAVGLAGTRLYSEPAPSEATVMAALQALKAANLEMIQRQEKTLKTLDELRGQAEQLKSFGKRT